MFSLSKGMRRAAKQYYKKHQSDQKHITAVKEAIKTIELSPITEQSHLSEQDIPLIVVARDSEARYPDFLRHYREIGITRFIIVDNNSKDNSINYLKTQSDIDIWLWSQNFGELEKCAVLQNMINLYGLYRWYMVIDIDEYFVYSGMENYKLLEFIIGLQHVGEQQVLAPMVDMFSTSPITVEDMSPSTPLSNLCDHFDTRGYSYTYNEKKKFLDIRGGPRARLFEMGDQKPPLLTKIPLYYANPDTFLVNAHFIAPNSHSYLWPRAALLHFKFLADAEKAIDQAIQEGLYYDNASEHRIYKKNIDLIQSGLQPDNVLMRYQGPQSLIEAGIMGTPPWAALHM
ncbi:MAG: glycosyltransferase family 2 protein [Pseudomonadota bacterium]